MLLILSALAPFQVLMAHDTLVDAQDKLAERGNVATRLHEAIRIADAKGELTGPERQRLACVSAAYKHATSSFEGVEALLKQTIIFHDR